MADDICMAVIVDDHIHLRNARQLIIYLDAEKVIFGEIVPVIVVFGVLLRIAIALREAAIRLAPHMVKRIKEEASRAAGGIKNNLFALGIEHFDSQCDELAWSEVLAEGFLEEASHELFECNAFRVQFGAVE